MRQRGRRRASSRSRRITSQSSQQPCRKVPSSTRTRRARISAGRSRRPEAAPGSPSIAPRAACACCGRCVLGKLRAPRAHHVFIRAFRLAIAAHTPACELRPWPATPVLRQASAAARSLRLTSLPSSSSRREACSIRLGRKITGLGQVAHVAGGDLRRAEAAVGPVLEVEADLGRC